MSNIQKARELMNKIPEITKNIELHDQISVKTLEIINEINQKIDNIIIPKLEKLEKQPLIELEWIKKYWEQIPDEWKKEKKEK